MRVYVGRKTRRRQLARLGELSIWCSNRGYKVIRLRRVKGNLPAAESAAWRSHQRLRAELTGPLFAESSPADDETKILARLSSHLSR